MKKLLSTLLVVVLVLTMSVSAMAADDNTISINNAEAGETYKIYKMLDLSVDLEAGAYTYTVAEGWESFFTSGDGKDYVVIEDGFVTWNENKKDDESMIAFGKAAAAYAATLTALHTITPENDGTITFEGLEDGYYLVTSTLGTAAMTETTPAKEAVTITEKNPIPTIDKVVQEDSQADEEGNGWGETNTAQIGDTVNYKTTVHARPGARNYVVHDKMTEGLTFTEVTAITMGNKTLTKGTDYTVVTEGLNDGCTFHINFEQSILDTITEDTDIVIEYTAVLNDKAVVSSGTNDNETNLTYGNSGNTEWDTTKTTTFTFDLVKTNDSNEVITGATFELYDAETDGNKIALVKDSDGTYRVATEKEKSAEGFTSAIIEAGQATIKGLDADTTYYLEEVTAPAGYNKLSERVEVAIEEANLIAKLDGTKWSEGGVHVVNNAGTELPSTGGIGTTIFYIAGGLMMAAAVVLLVTKKRMKTEG